MIDERRIAYFSMEIGLSPELPTYAGGLGVLAGDTIRSAAELHVPMAAVSLLHRKGYFFQRLDPTGWQTEEPASWVIENFLQDPGARVSVTIEGRPIEIRAWRYDVRHSPSDEFMIPVFLLDTDLPTNSDWDRRLTDYLYGGDQHFRLCQEVVLGIGGIKMLRSLGYSSIDRYHMNEGHASLLTLELLDEQAASSGRTYVTHEDIGPVRKKCIFTTHTPVPAGHDQFPMELVNRVLGRRDVYDMKDVFCCEGSLNPTYLALNLSHYVNGVAKRHGLVTQHMFGRYVIDAITNGVHAATWVSEPFAKLYDQKIPGWRDDNYGLRSALGISADDVWAAHQQAKRALIEHINTTTNAAFDLDVLTLGFARRATAYKRADLVFDNPDRLRRIAKQVGRLQIVFAGKAHPQDFEGKKIIQRIYSLAMELREQVPIVYLSNYEMGLARLLTAGCDLWLNTPQPPLEASGTSGMKAALNGVPSLSILDGWWVEGCIEGVTGWAIGDGESAHRSRDADSLYHQLEGVVLPMFYKERSKYIEVMRHAIALNGSFFNTQRMLQQYAQKAYL